MELYEWGWIKKIPRLAVVNSEGASTLYDLYNGKFEKKNYDGIKEILIRN